jgi:hypothetical protein
MPRERQVQQRVDVTIPAAVTMVVHHLMSAWALQRDRLTQWLCPAGN